MRFGWRVGCRTDWWPAVTLRCSGCREEKPQAAFGRNAAHPTGFHNWCRECRSTRRPAGVRRLRCRVCAVVFEHEGRQTPAFCSTTCRRVAIRAARPRAGATARACVVCGSDFVAAGRSQVCGQRCRIARHTAQSLARRLGVPVADVVRLQTAEVCAACGEPFGDETPCIDHCHSGGHVRGAVHRKCNVGLGMAEDDAGKLHAWAVYLCRDSFDLRDLCVR